MTINFKKVPDQVKYGIKGLGVILVLVIFIGMFLSGLSDNFSLDAVVGISSLVLILPFAFFGMAGIEAYTPSQQIALILVVLIVYFAIFCGIGHLIKILEKRK